jgi:hypothetical protein
MKRDEKKEIIKKNIQRSIGKSKRLGGQQCGLEILPVILKSEDLQIEISINHFRQNHKNAEYGYMIFDLIIEDLI